MITNDEIYKVYDQFQRDLNIKLPIPSKNIHIIRTDSNEIKSKIGKITKQYFEIYINKNIFDNNKVNHEYLQQILYHEFSHVEDRFNYFHNIENEFAHQMFLFPYTEYYASKNEIKKILNLYFNPLRKITYDTNVYGRYEIISLKAFLEDNNKFFLHIDNSIKLSPNSKNIKTIIYLFAYYTGYYSILKNYKINFQIPFDDTYNFVKNDFDRLQYLLLNNTPSDELCFNAYIIAHNIFNKMIETFM